MKHHCRGQVSYLSKTDWTGILYLLKINWTELGDNLLLKILLFA
jgi:hypothetical protein